MAREKLIRVWEVMETRDEPGPMGDGVFITRFRSEAEARKFARGRTCYAGDASVSCDEVPRRLAARWGLA